MPSMFDLKADTAHQEPDPGEPSEQTGTQSPCPSHEPEDLPHTVQFYEDDAFLVESVKTFVMEGRSAGARVVLVMTPRHQQAVAQALERTGGTDGSIEYYDAETAMGKFMVDGWPDERLFRLVVGTLVQPPSQDRPVRVFGEMVALLWEQQRYRAALRLEELWNALIRQQPCALLCAYCITGFRSEDTRASYLEVCHLHDQVRPAERAA